jgi:hypothetical protein
MKKSIASLSVMFGMLAACAGEVSEGQLDEATVFDDDAGVAEIEGLEQALDEPSTRADYRSDLVLHEGAWGTWSTSWCQPGTYAVSYKQRVERSQGKGDDTALNAIALWCAKKNAASTSSANGGNQALAHPGLYGDWSEWEGCGAVNGKVRPMIGGKMRFEGKQGADSKWRKGLQGDDTAGNDVHMKCSSGGYAEADLEGKWGTWYQERTCPEGTAVCGISVRTEASQGSKDDTALNGVKLKCCTF